MNQHIFSVRELQKEDIISITRYWLESDNEFLKTMGVEIAKIPAKEQWETMLNEQTVASAPLRKKNHTVLSGRRMVKL